MLNTEASASDRLLERVRKLLAKAEDESVTPPEAQALTAKAAELMAKYGIDRALLAADRPETDQPASRILDIGNPWARVKAHLLCGLGSALRCQCILLTGTSPGTRIHVFGYGSDIERTDLLYTSVLIQMWHGLAAQLAARLRHRGDLQGPGRGALGREPGDRRGRARKFANRACPRRPGPRHPREGGAGIPGDPHRPRHL